jgi:hypothetical protein
MRGSTQAKVVACPLTGKGGTRLAETAKSSFAAKRETRNERRETTDGGRNG